MTWLGDSKTYANVNGESVNIGRYIIAGSEPTRSITCSASPAAGGDPYFSSDSAGSQQINSAQYNTRVYLQPNAEEGYDYAGAVIYNADTGQPLYELNS